MCDSFKKLFSGSYTLYHEIFAWSYYLIYTLYLTFPTLLPIWVQHKRIIDKFLLLFGTQNVHKHEMFPTREEKQRRLRQMNFPEERKDALLWNSTQSWNQSTQEVIYQHSLKVTISNSENHPREGFRISKCFWDSSRKQYRRKHHL